MIVIDKNTKFILCNVLNVFMCRYLFVFNWSYGIAYLNWYLLCKLLFSGDFINYFY